MTNCFFIAYAKGNFWNDNVPSEQTKMIVRVENQAWKWVGTKTSSLPGGRVLARVECMSSYHFQSLYHFAEDSNSRLSVAMTYLGSHTHPQAREGQGTDYRMYYRMLSFLSCVQLFPTQWMAVHETPVSMGFSGQEYCSGLLCPSPRDLPYRGIEPVSLRSLACHGQVDSLPLVPPGKPLDWEWKGLNIKIRC